MSRYPLRQTRYRLDHQWRDDVQQVLRKTVDPPICRKRRRLQLKGLPDDYDPFVGLDDDDDPDYVLTIDTPSNMRNYWADAIALDSSRPTRLNVDSYTKKRLTRLKRPPPPLPAPPTFPPANQAKRKFPKATAASTVTAEKSLRNFYATIGATRYDLTFAEIRKLIRDKMLTLHPDKHGGQVQPEYDVLDFVKKEVFEDENTTERYNQLIARQEYFAHGSVKNTDLLAMSAYMSNRLSTYRPRMMFTVNSSTLKPLPDGMNNCFPLRLLRDPLSIPSAIGNFDAFTASFFAAHHINAFPGGNKYR